jgi:hypothetical protein
LSLVSGPTGHHVMLIRSDPQPIMRPVATAPRGRTACFVEAIACILGRSTPATPVSAPHLKMRGRSGRGRGIVNVDI